jgi:hypothetical protein
MCGVSHDDDDDDDTDCYDADGSDEYDLPEGVYHDDSLAMVRCRYCREDMLEDLECCPACGQYQSREEVPGVPRSGFFWVMMVLAIIVAFAFLWPWL